MEYTTKWAESELAHIENHSYNSAIDKLSLSIEQKVAFILKAAENLGEKLQCAESQVAARSLFIEEYEKLALERC